jgi:hypothetical protein
MRTFAMGAAAASLGLFAAARPAPPAPARPPDEFRVPERGAVPAPVYYEDTMLVLVTDRGVASVCFPTRYREPDRPGVKPDREGVEYRYRFLPAAGGREESGKGEVTEWPRRHTVIRAGPIELVWSAQDVTKGWVYYSPEKMSVNVALLKRLEPSAVDHRKAEMVSLFDKIDLRRFLKK